MNFSRDPRTPIAVPRIGLLLIMLGLFSIHPMDSFSGENQPQWDMIEDRIRQEFADFKVPGEFREQYRSLDAFVEVLRYRETAGDNDLTSDDIRSMDPESLKRRFNRLAIDELLYEAAIQSGYVEGQEEIKESLELSRIPQLAPFVYEEKVRRPGRQLSEKEIEEEYNRNREKYYNPWKVSFRQIHLSVYRDYTVQPGDTIDSIASRISEDPEVKTLIRDRQSRKPVWDPQRKISSPLQDGQILLVPMTAEEKKAVRERMESIADLLKHQADFVETAKQYSDSPDRGVLRTKFPEKDSPPMLPEILEAIRKTPAGAISPIVETKHGFDIYKVEESVEPFHTPLAEVRSSIATILIDRKEAKVKKQFMASLEKRYEQEGTLKVLESYPRMKREDALLVQYGLDEGIDRTPGFLSAYRAFKIGIVSALYRDYLVGQLIGNPEDGKYIELMGGKKGGSSYEAAKSRVLNILSEYLLEKSGGDYRNLLK